MFCCQTVLLTDSPTDNHRDPFWGGCYGGNWKAHAQVLSVWEHRESDQSNRDDRGQGKGQCLGVRLQVTLQSAHSAQEQTSMGLGILILITYYCKSFLLFIDSRFLKSPENFDPEFHFEHRGHVKMKGKPEPMECYFMTRKTFAKWHSYYYLVICCLISTAIFCLCI